MAKTAWGLDVSGYSVKAVRLQRAGDTAQLTHIDDIKIPHPEDESIDPEDGMREALQTFASRNKTKGDVVVASFPGHATFNRFIKLPPVEESRMPEIVRYEAQQHIPFPLDDVIWGYQAIDRDYEIGEEKEVVIFAIKRDIVMQFMGNLAMAQVQPGILQFAPVALYNFAIFDQDPAGSTVILDIGADNTDLIVTDEMKFWIRNLPLAGNDVTKAIQKKFGIPRAEAEKLKCAAARSKQAAKIFNVIKPVMRDLVGEVHRSIGYYKSLSKTAKFDKILIVGNASKTLNFQKFLSQQLQMPVTRLAKLGRVKLGPKVGDQNLQESLPSLGVAIGLALQGLDLTTNRINLLPPEMLAKKEASKKQPFFVAAMACVGLTVGAMYVSASGKVDGLRADAGMVEAVAREVAESKQRYRAQAAKFGPAENSLDALVGLAPERDLSLKVLNAIHELPVLKKNGDKAVPDEEKLWILKLSAKADEKKETSEEPDPANPGMTRQVTTTSPFLTVETTVAITTRKTATGQPDADASMSFVNENLRFPVARIFQLEGRKGLSSASPESSEPVPRLRTADADRAAGTEAGGFFGSGAGDDVGKYYRFSVRWVIPMGEAARKAMAQPAPGGEAAPAEEGG